MAPRVTLSVDFGQGFTNAWNSVVNTVPKLIAFAVILVIGWMVARFIARVLDGLLRRVGFERVAERGGISRALAGSSYDATGILCKIVYYAVLLMTLQMGFGVFGTNPISTMLNGIVSWLPKGIVACVIVVIAMAVARAVRDIVTNALSGVSYGKTLGALVWAFIVALGAFAALGQAGVATAVTGPLLTAVLASIAGVIIVGVGGGLITPMRSRWERALNVVEREAANARPQVTAYQKGREDMLTNQPSTAPTTQPAQTYGRESGTTS